MLAGETIVPTITRRSLAQVMANAATFANERTLIFAGLDDTDRAVAALDDMAMLGPQRVGLYLDYPELTALRMDPRVAALRRKLGLP